MNQFDVVQQFTLSNGIRVIVDDMPWSHNVAVTVAIDSSPKYENDMTSGISHFVEHMLFQSNGRHTSRDIANLIEDMGAASNAMTTPEATAFYVNVPSDSMRAALELVAEVIMSDEMTEDDIENQRSVILHELRGEKDNHFNQLLRTANQVMYPGQAYARPVGGTIESVSSISREQLIEWKRRYYRPSGIVIAVAGGFYGENPRHIIEDLLGDWRPLVEATRIVREPISFDPATHVESRDCEQAYVAVGYNSFGREHEDWYLNALLAHVLGSSPASRLYQTIREELGACYQVGTIPILYEQAGTFVNYAITSPELVDTVVRKIREISHELSGSITEDELRRAKAAAKGEFSRQFEKVSMRSLAHASYMLGFGRPFSMTSLMDSFNKSTMEDLDRVARQVLGQHPAVVVLMPREVDEIGQAGDSKKLH